MICGIPDQPRPSIGIRKKVKGSYVGTNGGRGGGGEGGKGVRLKPRHKPCNYKSLLYQNCNDLMTSVTN